MKKGTPVRLRLLLGLISVPAIALSGLPALAQPTPTYTVTDLGTLGGDCFALDINLRAQVVGTCRATLGHEQAFLYSGGVMSPLGTLGGAYSYAYAINQIGDITGDSETAAGDQRAYLRRGSTMTDLGTLGGGRSQGNGINSRAQIAGWAYPATGPQHAFLFENGNVTDIGASFSGGSIATDINEFGRVVGYYDVAGGSRPFRWAAGVTADLGSLGGTKGGANKINLFGEVAGWSSFADNVSRPVIFRSGNVVDLGTLGTGEGAAWGLNDLGRAVGYSLTEDGRSHAILYRSGVLYDLNNLIRSDSGVELIAATAIDDLGRIVGYGCFGGVLSGSACNGGQIRAVLLTPPPGQMLWDLLELLRRLRTQNRAATGLGARLEDAGRCLDAVRDDCLNGPLGAFAAEVELQAGAALTDEQARVLAAAAEGLRATQNDR
ncbi:MAG TPA: hypothetical protein VMT45_04510 [Thermoanaerobaculaceae bacterium]|nr:hypothetical protein [Thermoanaerobaculaceae bacterium]